MKQDTGCRTTEQGNRILIKNGEVVAPKEAADAINGVEQKSESGRKAKYKSEDSGDTRYYPTESNIEGSRWTGKRHSISDAFDEDNNSFKQIGSYKNTDIYQLPDGYFSINPRISDVSFKTKDALENYIDNGMSDKFDDDYEEEFNENKKMNYTFPSLDKETIRQAEKMGLVHTGTFNKDTDFNSKEDVILVGTKKQLNDFAEMIDYQLNDDYLMSDEEFDYEDLPIKSSAKKFDDDYEEALNQLSQGRGYGEVLNGSISGEENYDSGLSQAGYNNPYFNGKTNKPKSWYEGMDNAIKSNDSPEKAIKQLKDYGHSVDEEDKTYKLY